MIEVNIAVTFVADAVPVPVTVAERIALPTAKTSPGKLRLDRGPA
jgi:hypothetical protein